MPVIIRMEGTNAEEARQLLAESPLQFIVAQTLDEAAKNSVAAAKGGLA